MRKILLTILPVVWPNMPPVGLGYLQSYLEMEGVEAHILDINNMFYNLSDDEFKRQWLISCNDDLENRITSIMKDVFADEYDAVLHKMLDYDIICFSCFKSNLRATIDTANEVKSKKKGIKIVFGGPEITRQYFKTTGKFSTVINGTADYLVVGEGELALSEYIKSGPNGLQAAEFKQLENLKGLPYPQYHGLDLSSYPRRDAIPVQLSRGCIRKCSFCSEKLLCRGFRVRDIESVIKEIRHHRECNGVKKIIFFDSLINGDLAVLERLCDSIIDNFGSVSWEAQAAVRRDMDKPLFDKIKKSGCYNLFVGLESGSDKTLKKMKKGFTGTDAVDFFNKLNGSGLNFGVSIIVGFPGESDSDFRESLEFVIKHKDIIPKIEQVNPFVYYDGTAADESGDYKNNFSSKERMDIFVRAIKENRYKYTNAFIGNLIEKTC